MPRVPLGAVYFNYTTSSHGWQVLFGDPEAAVACRGLGYRGGGLAYPNATVPVGNTASVFYPSRFTCSGAEQRLPDCNRTPVSELGNVTAINQASATPVRR